MSAMSIYATKNFKKLLQNQEADDLRIQYVALEKWDLQICSNGDPMMTLNLMSRSNLLPNAFKWEKCEKFFFFNSVEASHYSHLIW